jgi:hypothetical protein
MIGFNEFQFLLGCCNGHIKYIHETRNQTPSGSQTWQWKILPNMVLMGKLSNHMGELSSQLRLISA